MAEEKTLSEEQLEGKSLEELEKLEDAIVAESGEDQGRGEEAEPHPAMQGEAPAKPAEKPADPPPDPEDPPLPKSADPADGDGDGEPAKGDPPGDDPELPPIGDQPPAGDPPPAQTEAEIRKHTSPPSKWADHRHKQKELQAKLEVAETKAAQADQYKEGLTKLQEEMEWMKSALVSRKVDIPTSPLDMFTDERLTEIQDEFGSEVADLFRATKAALGGTTPPAKADPPPGEDPTAQATPPAQPPAGDQPEDPEVVAIREAMQKNDHLMYWAEEKPELLNRAIAVDAAWLKHPQYTGLSYDKRFQMVVKQVQDEEVKKGVQAAQTQGGDANPDVPASLSGSGGEAPTQGGMTPAERVLAAPTPEKQQELYDGLSESEQDAVDQYLGI